MTVVEFHGVTSEIQYTLFIFCTAVLGRGLEVVDQYRTFDLNHSFNLYIYLSMCTEMYDV